MDCIFCKIIAGEIPVKALYRDDEVIVFPDINPAAPTHFLVIPYKHIETVLDFQPDDEQLIAAAYRIAVGLARSDGVADSGFRVVVNCNRDGGQSVYHVHFHVLGGRRFAWPPG